MDDRDPEARRRALSYPFAAPPEPPGWAAHSHPFPQRTEETAVIALVLALVGLVTCGITGIPGAICGHLALRRIERGGYQLGGEGMARAGLIIGWIFGGLGLAFWLLVAFGFVLGLLGY